MILIIVNIFSSCSYLSLNCDSLLGQDREACFADRILQQYESEPQNMLLLLDKKLSSTKHDFVLMELTRQYHPQSRHLCQKITDSILQERCMMMVSRPHLQRKKMNKE